MTVLRLILDTRSKNARSFFLAFKPNEGGVGAKSDSLMAESFFYEEIGFDPKNEFYGYAY